MRPKLKLIALVLIGVMLMVLSVAPTTTHAQQDSRYFSQTGYRVDNDAIWQYFQARGGVSTFGYPVSNTFLFQGFPVQIFQRHVLQATGEQARPANLLDPGMLPVTRHGGLTLPTYDPQVAGAAPTPDTANYEAAVQRHLAAIVPNSWNGTPVNFLNYYLSSAPAGTPGSSTLVALEVWGFPTSQPVRDPNNSNFVYQRFQRGILHYQGTEGSTRGILLGDAFKSVLRGQNLSSDLRNEMEGSPLLNLYNAGQPNCMARTAPEMNPPITRENSDLCGAFDQESGQLPTPVPPTFTRVDVYLVALDTGGPIGCNDSLVAVERPIEPTQAPLAAAMRELLSIRESMVGQSGLYNALYRTDLHIQEITLENRHATIRLQGEYQIGGVCDEPRVQAQLRETALQFATVDSVDIFINGVQIE